MTNKDEKNLNYWNIKKGAKIEYIKTGPDDEELIQLFKIQKQYEDELNELLKEEEDSFIYYDKKTDSFCENNKTNKIYESSYPPAFVYVDNYTSFYHDLDDIQSVQNDINQKSYQPHPSDYPIPENLKNIVRYNHIFNEWENCKLFFCQKTLKWKKYDFLVKVPFKKSKQNNHYYIDEWFIDSLYLKASFTSINAKISYYPVPPSAICYNKYTNTYENRNFKIPELDNKPNSQYQWTQSKRYIYYNYNIKKYKNIKSSTKETDHPMSPDQINPNRTVYLDFD